MGYHNTGADILIATGTIHEESMAYNINSHGDAVSTYESMVNADLPSYTGRFYSPTEHEQFSDIRYSKLEVGYDKGLRSLHEAVQGLPLEFYIPLAIESADNGSASPAAAIPVEVIKPEPLKIPKAHLDEIERSMREAVDSIEVRIETPIRQRITVRRTFKAVAHDGKIDKKKALTIGYANNQATR